MSVEYLDTKNFDNALKSAKNVIVDFSAVYCRPCQLLFPKFEKLAETEPDIKFYKTDVDKEPELVEKYRIKCMPTFLFFKNTLELEPFRIQGASLEKLKDNIKIFKDVKKE